MDNYIIFSQKKIEHSTAQFLMTFNKLVLAKDSHFLTCHFVDSFKTPLFRAATSGAMFVGCYFEEMGIDCS